MDKHKSKSELKAAGQQKLQEFRERRQNRGGRSKPTKKNNNLADASESNTAETSLGLEDKKHSPPDAHNEVDRDQGQSDRDHQGGDTSSALAAEVNHADDPSVVQHAKEKQSSTSDTDIAHADTDTTSEGLVKHQDETMALADTILESDRRQILTEEREFEENNRAEPSYADQVTGTNELDSEDHENVLANNVEAQLSTSQSSDKQDISDSCEKVELPTGHEDNLDCKGSSDSQADSHSETLTHQEMAFSHLGPTENRDEVMLDSSIQVGDSEQVSATNISKNFDSKEPASSIKSEEFPEKLMFNDSIEGRNRLLSLNSQEPNFTTPSETEEKVLLIQRLEGLGEKLGRLIKERGSKKSMGTPGTLDVQDRMTDKWADPQICNETCWIDCMDRFDLDVSCLDQMIKEMELEKLSTLSKIKEARQLRQIAETDLSRDPDEPEMFVSNDLSLVYEFEKFADESQKKEAEAVKKSESLEHQLRTVTDERDALIATLDKSIASHHTEAENSEKQAASEISKMRELIRNAIVERKLLPLDDLADEEGDTLKSHSLTAQKTDYGSFQTSKLKEELDQILKDNANVSQELNNVRNFYEKARLEKEELAKELQLSKEELEQVKLNYCKLEEGNTSLLAELKECRQQWEDLITENNTLKDTMQMKDDDIQNLQGVTAQHHQEAAVIQSLEIENRILLQQLEQVKNHVKKVEDECVALESQNIAMQNKLQGLEDYKANSLGELTKFDELSEENRNLMKNLEAVKHHLEESREENVELRKKCATLSQQAQFLCEEKDGLVSEIQRLKDQPSAYAKITDIPISQPKNTDSLGTDSGAVDLLSMEPSDHISFLEGHLNEAQTISEKLQKAIHDMSLAMVIPRSESSRAPVSRLIQAFEGKSCQEEAKDASTIQTEEKSEKFSENADGTIVSASAQEITYLKKHFNAAGADIQSLRDILTSMKTDVRSVAQHTFEEKKQKDHMSPILKQLEADINTLKQEKERQEEIVSLVSNKNKQLESQTLEDTSQIQSLQTQLNNQEEDMNMKTELLCQLEGIKEDLMNQTSVLGEEVSYYKNSILSAAETLEQSAQNSGFDSQPEQYSSVDLHLDAIVKVIQERSCGLKELEERLELCSRENIEIQKMYEEAVQNLESMRQQRKETAEKLNAFCNKVAKFVVNESVSYNEAEAQGMPNEREGHAFSTEEACFSSMMHFAETFERMMDEQSHLNVKTEELKSFLFEKDKVIEELNVKCSELLIKVTKNESYSSSLSSQMSELMEENAKLTDQNNNLCTELSTIKNVLSECNKICDKLGKFVGIEPMTCEGQYVPVKSEGDVQTTETTSLRWMMHLSEIVQKHTEKWSKLEDRAVQLEHTLSEKERVIDELDIKCSELLMENTENDISSCYMASLLSELTDQNHALVVELATMKKVWAEQEQRLAVDSEIQETTNMDLHAVLEKLVTDVGEISENEMMPVTSTQNLSRLEFYIDFVIRKYKASLEQYNALEMSMNELAAQFLDVSGHEEVRKSLPTVLREGYIRMETELTKLHKDLEESNLERFKLEEESTNLKQFSRKLEEEINAMREDLEKKNQTCSSLRDKLGQAVSRGKAVVQQRDSLKQSLAEKLNELERCQKDLQIKNSALHEAEAKIKSFGHTDERIESLQIELAYVRDSTKNLRESLYHKDTILQKIEETLESLSLPEQLHSMEINEKIEWLANIYSSAGTHVQIDSNQRLLQINDDHDASNSEGYSLSIGSIHNMDEFRKKYEEIQGKYISLAEQSDMLEQSLLERNYLIQRWEEALNNVNLPASVQLLEPEDRIEWLGSQLQQAQENAKSLEYEAQNIRASKESCSLEFEKCLRNMAALEKDISSERYEKELLSNEVSELKEKLGYMTEKESQLASDNKSLSEQLSNIQSQLACMNNDIDGMLKRCIDMIEDVLQNEVDVDDSPGYTGLHLEMVLKKLTERYTSLLQDVNNSKGSNQETAQGINNLPDGSNDLVNLQAIVAEKENELLQIHGNLEQASLILASYKSEQDKLSNELELTKKERDELQLKLDQTNESLSIKKRNLTMAVKKGKGLEQECNSLKHTLNDKEAEIEQLRTEIQTHMNTINDQETKICDLSAALGHFKSLEVEITNVKHHEEELEKSLLDSNRAMQKIMNLLDSVDFIRMHCIPNPVEAIELLVKSFYDLQDKVLLLEEETRKSQRASELLARELDEVNERLENLEDELATSKAKATNLEKEKKAIEKEKDDSLASLQQTIATQAEELQHCFKTIKNQGAGFVTCVVNLQKLRREQSFIFPQLANDFVKKLELLRSIEVTLEKIVHQVAGSKVSRTAGTLLKVLEEAKIQKSSPFSGTDSRESSSNLIEDNAMYQGKMPEELLSSLASLFQGALQDVEILRDRMNAQSLAFNEGIAAVSELAQISIQKVEAMKGGTLSAYAELQMQIRNAEFDKEKVSKERDLAKSKISELEKQLETLKAEYQSLRRNYESLKTQQGSIRRRDEEMKTLRDTLVARNKELDDLMHAYDESDNQGERLKSKVEELENIIQEKEGTIENLEALRDKTALKMSNTLNNLNCLRQLSEGLVSEIETLQLKLESRDAEISHLRQEVTKCTNNLLITQEKMKGNTNELNELQQFVETLLSKFSAHQIVSEDSEGKGRLAPLNALENKICMIISESENIQAESRRKDILLQDSQTKIHDLSNKINGLESLLQDKENQVEQFQRERSSGLTSATKDSEISEIEEIGQMSKRPHTLFSVAPHVRSTRKIAGDQVGISIDVEAGQSVSELEDNDKAKAHVFKSLTTSMLIPKATRPLADRIDGIWVSCGQMLMRRPTARIGVMLYWLLLHYFMVALFM